MSRFSLNGDTNRMFFKRFVAGGYYKVQIEQDEKVIVTMYCMLNPTKRFKPFGLNVYVRCNKKGIQVSDIKEEDAQHLIVLKMPNYFKSFGLMRGKKCGDGEPLSDTPLA
jgi:hypothetical protein